MKKLSAMLLALAGFNVQAQETELFTIDAKKVSSETIPTEILAAVKSDFPGNDVIDYYLLPAEKVSNEWDVTVNDHLKSGEDVDHYTVMLKGKKGGYVYGLYNKEGDLESMKVLAKDFALPSAIQTAATSGEYSGYAIKSDKYVKVVNAKTDKEYVEVVVAKDGKNKKLYFDSNGKFVKEKP